MGFTPEGAAEMTADEVMAATIEAWLEVTLGQKLGLASFHREAEHLTDTILGQLSEAGFQFCSTAAAARPPRLLGWWQAARARGGRS
jgi:hypothetical protein